MITVVDVQKFAGGACDNGQTVSLASDFVPAQPTRRIWVGTAGDIKVDTVGGQTGITYKNVPVGYFYVHATKIYSSGTAASNLVAEW